MVNLLAEEKNGRCSLGRKSLLSANTNAWKLGTKSFSD
jgi:hypothetical protein